MVILTNGLTDVVDEGFLKVANSLIKRIKSDKNDAYIVTYERKSELSDRHIAANKLLINKELISIIRNRKEEVLYVPFPAKSIATSLRVFVLSVFSKKGIRVVWVQKASINFISKILLKLSRAKIIVLSKETKTYFSNIIQEERLCYLKTGVDVEKFKPVDLESQKSLKKKYGLDPNRPVILHVGHLKKGRNIAQLLKLDQKYQILLVLSTLFQNDADEELRNRLLNAPNVRLIEEYLPNVQEIYQLSDLYFFPVVDSGNCIDVPLSCLEAAACNKPVVTTGYGEMREFLGKKGFYYIDSFEEDRLDQLICEALSCAYLDTRSSVLAYDWQHAIKALR